MNSQFVLRKLQYSLPPYDFAQFTLFTSKHSWNIQSKLVCPHFENPSSSSTFTGQWPTKVTLPLPKESLQNLKLSNLPLTSSSVNATPKSPISSQAAIWASVSPSFLSQTASCPPFPHLLLPRARRCREGGESSTCHLSPPYLSHLLSSYFPALCVPFRYLPME